MQYHVDVFVPKPPAASVATESRGWSPAMCAQYAAFLNHYGEQGWALHSTDVQTDKMPWFLCVFERPRDDAK